MPMPKLVNSALLVSIPWLTAPLQAVEPPGSEEFASGRNLQRAAPTASDGIFCARCIHAKKPFG